MSANRERIDQLALEVEKRLGLPNESIFFDRDCLVIHADVIEVWLERTPEPRPPVSTKCARCGDKDAVVGPFRIDTLCVTCVSDILTEESMGVTTPRDQWKCQHRGDYRVIKVDVDQHEQTVCAGCGEEIEL